MKIIRPDLGEIDFEFDKIVPNPEIDEKFGQNLVYLIGYDDTNQIFRFINVDSDGRVYVSSGSTKSNVGSVSRAAVDDTPVAILADNQDRQLAIIQNLGGEIVYLGFVDTVDDTTGFPLPVGGVWETSVWIGAIYAATTGATTEIAIIEME